MFPPPPASRLVDFVPPSACRSPARCESGLRLPDRPVCCGCRRVPEVAEYASVCFPDAKVRTSVGFALPASSFVEALKSEFIAVSGLFCPSGTGLESFGCKRLVKHTASSNLVPRGRHFDRLRHTLMHARTHAHTHS